MRDWLRTITAVLLKWWSLFEVNSMEIKRKKWKFSENVRLYLIICIYVIYNQPKIHIIIQNPNINNIEINQNGKQILRNIRIGGSEHWRWLARIYSFEKNLRPVQDQALVHFPSRRGVGYFIHFHRALWTCFCNIVWTAVSGLHVF